jgi:hypothetical protein
LILQTKSRPSAQDEKVEKLSGCLEKDYKLEDKNHLDSQSGGARDQV